MAPVPAFPTLGNDWVRRERPRLGVESRQRTQGHTHLVGTAVRADEIVSGEQPAEYGHPEYAETVGEHVGQFPAPVGDVSEALEGTERDATDAVECS